MESLQTKVEFIEAESRMMITRYWRGGVIGDKLVKDYKLSYKMNKFWESDI